MGEKYNKPEHKSPNLNLDYSELTIAELKKYIEHIARKIYLMFNDRETKEKILSIRAKYAEQKELLELDPSELDQLHEIIKLLKNKTDTINNEFQIIEQVYLALEKEVHKRIKEKRAQP